MLSLTIPSTNISTFLLGQNAAVRLYPIEIWYYLQPSKRPRAIEGWFLLLLGCLRPTLSPTPTMLCWMQSHPLYFSCHTAIRLGKATNSNSNWKCVWFVCLFHTGEGEVAEANSSRSLLFKKNWHFLHIWQNRNKNTSGHKILFGNCISANFCIERQKHEQGEFKVNYHCILIIKC